MTPERWQEVERLFHAALERDTPERAGFLARACATDADLRREVQALLDESSIDDDFLEGPPLEAAAHLLAGASTGSLAGQRFGDYDVTVSLGAGGMGEVYRARDLKLQREVAIKVLPPLLAGDAERIARFRREAQILATVNHPHIASIYSLEERDGVVGLVLELVEGPTLADRLASGPLPVATALPIARQIAEALEAAHAKGIVHRDLKPANIKAPPAGAVKVLDFGLAKSAVAAGTTGSSMLATIEATQQGMILGTAAYMSPEQARGLVVDTRTDIWAFGCVCYETLTGRKPFQGETIADCIAAILNLEPDWSALPSSTPASVIELVRLCLLKDTTARLQDIANAREILEDVAVSARLTHMAPVRVSPALVRRATWVALAATVVAAAAIGVRVVKQRSITPERLELSLPGDEFIAPSHSAEVALSPDGTRLAYASMKAMGDMAAMAGAAGADGSLTMPSSMPSMTMAEQIYVRDIAQSSARPIGGALGGAPFFSPDGRWLGFWHAPTATLRKVALTGGAPVKITDAVSGIAGAAWGPDDTIVFAWFDLFRVPAAGGSPTLLLKVEEQRGERFYRHPSILPSGKAVLFTIGMADTYSYDDAEIGVLSLESGKKKVLLEGGSSARYSPSGHLIYAREGKLLAVPFDPERLDITGEPFPVADGVFMSSNTGMAAYSISSNGHLVYAAGPIEQGTRMPVWVDRRGTATALPLPPRSYLHPRLSPDGRQLAIEVEGASHDVFVYDIVRGALTKLSFDGASHWPMFTPNGIGLTFRSWKTGTMTMWSMPADRSASPALLTNIGSMQSPESWSPDGMALAFTQMDDPASGSDIYAMRLHGDRTPFPVIRTKFSEGSPKFSPDGRWLAYSSNESGRPEVYVTAYPGPGSTIQVSNTGGTDPAWRRDGREFYYRNDRRMMAVDVQPGPGFTVSKPRMLWEGDYLAGVGSSCGMAGPTSANYDVTSDGQRFLMIKDESPQTTCKLLRFVPNWSATVRSP
jgi:serine/threonine protein kinase/Tol biopolymer transport system component